MNTENYMESDIKIVTIDNKDERFWGLLGEFLGHKKYKKEMPYIHDNDYTWLVYTDNDDGVVSFLSYTSGNYVKIQNLYTVDGFRNRGFAAKLVKEMIKLHCNKSIHALCGANSIGIFKKLNFEYHNNKKGNYRTLVYEEVGS